MANKKQSFAIKRPGGLTKAVGGKPSKNLKKVREIAAGNSNMASGARLFLNVFLPASKKRKKKSLLKK
jgi:hypothetical protein